MYADYTIYDFDADGRVVSRSVVPVDTDVQDNRQKWDWLATEIGASQWEPQRSFGGLNQITIQFRLPPEAPQTNLVAGLLGADAYATLHDPEGARIDLSLQLGRVVERKAYVDPDTGQPPIRDWEVVGSPIGPPFEDASKRLFQFRWTSHKPGDSVTGLSGTIYKLEMLRTSPFSNTPAWRGQ